MAQYRAGSGGGGVGRLTAQKAAQAKNKKKSPPGVLTRVLDVLSRGQYASAGLALGKGPKESLSYAWQGLQGKRKDSYADVLSQRLGIKGKPAALLGFVGDVGLDPTTYVGVGLGKAGAQAAGKAVGMKVGKELVEETGEKAIKAAVEVAEKATAEGAQKVAKKGGATLYKPPAQLAVKTADDLEDEAAKLLSMAKKSKNKAAKESMENQAAEVLGLAKKARKAGIVSSAAVKAAPESTKASKIIFDAIESASTKPSAKLSIEEVEAGVTRASKAAQMAGKGAPAAVKATESAAPKVVGHAATDLPAAATRRAVELKVLGKPIIKSERAYEAGAKVLRPIANTQMGNLVGRTFRTGHGLPQAIRNIERKSQGVGMQDLHDQLLDIKKVFAGTTKAQRKEIGAAVARGTVHTLDDTLRPLGEYAQKHLDDINPREGLSAGGKGALKMFDDDTFQALPEGALDDLPSEADDIADTLAKSFDKHITKQAYETFVKEVHDRFPDLMRDPDIRKALEQTKKVFTPGTPEGREWIKVFDKVQGYWKLAVTAPNPGFHIRNMMGDAYLNYLDGVVNPNVYKKAALIVGKKGKPTVHVAGKVLDGDDVMRLYREQGLHSKFAQTENLVGGTSSKVLDKIGEASNMREDFGRLAHFIDALSKEARHGKSFDDALEAAAERVRKFNIDYSDLTDMEKKFKRVIPFYTFVRKALPTQLEMTFTRPGRVAVLPKGKQAIERMLGVREEGDQSPLPGIDEALPPWMRDYLNISVGNQRVMSPDLPVDLLGQYANPVKGVLSGVTPFIKGPIELGTGKTVPEGFKQKASIARYIANQTPITRQVANYVYGDDDAVEKTKRWAVGPIASKVVSGPPPRKDSKSKKSTSSRPKVSSGRYRAGS